VKALGDDAQVIARLHLSAETLPSVLNRRDKNVIISLSMTASIPRPVNVSKRDHMGVLARFLAGKRCHA